MNDINEPIPRGGGAEEIAGVLPHFDESQQTVRFEDLGIDSFDLVTMRSSLEQKLNRTIPTVPAWVRDGGRHLQVLLRRIKDRGGRFDH